MSLKRCLVIGLRSLLAMALAFAAVYVVNAIGGAIAAFAGFPRGGERRLAWDLLWVALGGIAATYLVVRFAPVAPRTHAAALFMLALAICVAAVVRLGGDWPWWFSAGALLSLPLQVWLGMRLALLGRVGVRR